ncbi:MAG TPA: hypothetical protein VEX63_07255 [Flavisolibacter sp.]|jgi:hypothetical protein|nr:hypothetical protein [Flavisolibacter sp.]
MKPGFVTVYGKVMIENNSLFIRNVDVPFSRTAFAKILKELGVIAIFIMQFFRGEELRYYAGILLWGLILLYHIPEIYDLIIKRSYSNRIPLSQITGYDTKDQLNGLDVHVILRLKNGRYRTIVFRKLEQQYESFTELLSQYIMAPKYA